MVKFWADKNTIPLIANTSYLFIMVIYFLVPSRETKKTSSLNII